MASRPYLIGGGMDTTTPPSSYEKVWDDITQGTEGGVFAIVPDGTHNSDAWGVDEDGNTLDSEGASQFDFGRFQQPTELWWRFLLRGDAQAGRNLKRLLDRDPWVTEHHFTDSFQL